MAENMEEKIIIFINEIEKNGIPVEYKKHEPGKHELIFNGGKISDDDVKMFQFEADVRFFLEGYAACLSQLKRISGKGKQGK